MAGYWPISFLSLFFFSFFAFLWTKTKSRRTSVVNNVALISREQSGQSRSGRDRPILPDQVANQNTGLSCLLGEPLSYV